MNSIKRVVFTNASVFDGEADQLKRNINNLVIDGRVSIMGEQAIEQLPCETRIDLAGKTLMPGLIDAHFHCNSPTLNIPAIETMQSSQLAQNARRYLEETLMPGFSTVRDAGG